MDVCLDLSLRDYEQLFEKYKLDEQDGLLDPDRMVSMEFQFKVLGTYSHIFWSDIVHRLNNPFLSTVPFIVTGRNLDAIEITTIMEAFQELSDLGVAITCFDDEVDPYDWSWWASRLQEPKQEEMTEVHRSIKSVGELINRVVASDDIDQKTVVLHIRALNDCIQALKRLI